MEYNRIGGDTFDYGAFNPLNIAPIQRAQELHSQSRRRLI